MYSYQVRQSLSEEDRLHGRRVGEQLASARRGAGQSAQALAQAADVSIDTIRSIETGRVVAPSFLTVARVAGALDVSLDELHANASQAPQRRRASRK